MVLEMVLWDEEVGAAIFRGDLHGLINKNTLQMIKYSIGLICLLLLSFSCNNGNVGGNSIELQQRIDTLNVLLQEKEMELCF